MAKLVTLIALFAICLIAFSVGQDCIFEWDNFATVGNSENNIVDYTGQKISTLVEEDKTYHYITGPLNVKSEVDNSVLVFYIIQQFLDGNVMNVALDVREACYFYDNIYNEYLLPIAGTHNDFPPEGGSCPIKPFSANIFPVKSSEDLAAPSKLKAGKHYCEVTFLKNLNPVGGFIGNFTVLRE